MTARGRLRVVVMVLCLFGVGAAAINTTLGAAFLGGLLAVLVIVCVAQWVTGAAE